MNLTNNGKATIAFSVALAVLFVHEILSVPANPDLGAPSAFALQIAPVVAPVIVLLLAIAISWVWQGKRAGFILAIVVGVFESLDSIGAGIVRLSAGFSLAAAVYFFTLVTAALVVLYAYRGQRELAAEKA